MQEATDAELLRMLSVVSLASPLRHEYNDVYVTLFRRVSPEAPFLNEEAFAVPESPFRYNDQLVADLKRQHAPRLRKELRKENWHGHEKTKETQQQILNLG